MIFERRIEGSSCYSYCRDSLHAALTAWVWEMIDVSVAPVEWEPGLAGHSMDVELHQL